MDNTSVLLKSQERKKNLDLIIEQLKEFQIFLNELKGATDWSFVFAMDDSFSLEIRDQDLEDSDQSETIQLSIKIFVGNQTGKATCLGMQKMDWEQAAKSALDIALLSEPDPCSQLPDTRFFDHRLPNISLESLEEISSKTLFDYACESEKKALEGYPETVLQSNGSSVSAQYSLIIRSNSRGLWAVVPSTIFSHSIGLIAHGSQESVSSWEGQSVRQWSDLENTGMLATRVQSHALSQKERKSLVSGDYPIIFTKRCSGSLIKHLLTALSGRNQYLKTTYLHDKKGSQILPSWVDLWDVPHLDWSVGSYPIDQDGLITKEQKIISQGVVEQYLLSHYSAKRLGLEPNGLASGLMNARMTTNVDSFEDLLALYPACIVIDSVSGPGVNIAQGTYSRGAEGYFYKNGIRQFPLKEVTIATSLESFYLSLQAHAPDYDPWSAWQIGSLAFPSIRVSGDAPNVL